MARSRYVITEPAAPHFLTCTVLEWLPVFTRPDTVTILLESWQYFLIVPTETATAIKLNLFAPSPCGRGLG